MPTKYSVRAKGNVTLEVPLKKGGKTVGKKRKTYLSGIVYNVDLDTARFLQKDKRFIVQDLEEAKKATKKAEDQKPAIPKAWDKKLKELNEARVVDAPEIVDEIEDVKKLKWLLSNAEKKGTKAAIKRRLEELTE